MEVDLEQLRKAVDYINRVNSSNLYQLSIIDGEKWIEPSEELFNSWCFIGLNNVEFIKANYLTKNGEKHE